MHVQCTLHSVRAVYTGCSVYSAGQRAVGVEFVQTDREELHDLASKILIWVRAIEGYRFVS